MKLILESIVEGLSTRVDGTLSIKLSTQEIDPTTASNLFSFRGKYCKVLISDSNISTLEAEMVDSTQIVGSKKKTPSARFRAVLYRIWEQEQSPLEFESWYNSKMEDLITHYKSKLE